MDKTMTNDNEVVDTPQDVVEGQEPENPELEDVALGEYDDFEAAQKKIEGLDAQRRKYREQSQKKDEEIKSLREQLTSTKPEVKQEEKQQPTSLDSQYETIQHLKDLSQEEYQELKSTASRLGTSPENLVKDQLFQDRLKSLRDKKSQENKVPEPSSRAPKIAGKTYEESNPQERTKNFNFDSWKSNKGGKSNE